MGAVLNFNKPNIKEKAVQDLIDSLDKAYAEYKDMELRLCGLENRYNARLEQYIEAVGIDNVPPYFLDYKTP